MTYATGPARLDGYTGKCQDSIFEPLKALWETLIERVNIVYGLITISLRASFSFPSPTEPVIEMQKQKKIGSMRREVRKTASLYFCFLEA